MEQIECRLKKLLCPLVKDSCCAYLYYCSSYLKQSESFCFLNNIQINLIISEHFNHLPTSLLTPDISQDQKCLNYLFLLCSMRHISPFYSKYIVKKEYGCVPILSIWSRVHLCQKSSDEWDKFQIYNTLNENKLLHTPEKEKSFLTQTFTLHKSQTVMMRWNLWSLFLVNDVIFIWLLVFKPYFWHLVFVLWYLGMEIFVN